MLTRYLGGMLPASSDENFHPTVLLPSRGGSVARTRKGRAIADGGDPISFDAALDQLHQGSVADARLGGDKFAAFTFDTAAPSVIIDRITRAAEELHHQASLPHPISFSIAVTFCDPADIRPLAEYLSQADKKMYE